MITKYTHPRDLAACSTSVSVCWDRALPAHRSGKPRDLTHTHPFPTVHWAHCQLSSNYLTLPCVCSWWESGMEMCFVSWNECQSYEGATVASWSVVRAATPSALSPHNPPLTFNEQFRHCLLSSREAHPHTHTGPCSPLGEEIVAAKPFATLHVVMETGPTWTQCKIIPWPLVQERFCLLL